MRRKKLVIGGIVFLIFLSSAAFIMGRSNFARIYVDKGGKYFEQDELDKAMVEYGGSSDATDRNIENLILNIKVGF